MESLIPKPTSVIQTEGVFSLTPTTTIYVQADNEELLNIGRYLAERLRLATGYGLAVEAAEGERSNGHIYLTLSNSDLQLGDEGYELTITPEFVALSAHQPAGLFRGVQTMRQLLPPSIEAATVQDGRWELPTGTIRDYPRFGWRGAMLDVSRHFFGVEDVKQFIDWIAYYKLNRLHLHLTDDQGWRIMIESWPNLAEYGGSTAAGGGAGGYYTQADYVEIVAYAQSRYIMVIPEIDMPGHTNAALASYAELNCDGVAKPLYTGVDVGASALCVEKEITYTFIDDVIREMAAITPGPYIHIGGDEAFKVKAPQYIPFIERVQSIVLSYGKQMIGWEEIAQARLLPTTIAQHWHNELARTAAEQGAKVILSPASRSYLDMQYDESTPIGQHWAGYVEVDAAYSWDPATQINGVGEADIAGVEAPLWTETIATIDDVGFMVFPRLPGIAEIGWSAADGRDWNEYCHRLAAHGPRMAAMGINFYPSPLIPWQS